MLIKKGNKIEKYIIVITLLLISFLDVKAQDNPPNIVLIMADDFGVECVNAYGGTSYKTPNIDKLASLGIKF